MTVYDHATPSELARRALDDVTVVVPARNAEDILAECLASIQAEQPREVIVVDGQSTDATREIAMAHGAEVVSDDGRGLPYARMLGASLASAQTVALIDADVVVPPGALHELYDEFSEGGYDGLQAGLRGVAMDDDYWSRALAFHQNIGLVRRMFGVSATLIRRDLLLDLGFDDRFSSGEDIDLRHRMAQSERRIGVAERARVFHRFPGGWRFAKGQWLADGAGLGRMMRVHGLDHTWLTAVPLAAALRGLLVGRTVRWLPYFACFTLYNYAAMLAALLTRGGGERGRHARGMAHNGFFLAAARMFPMAIGFAFWITAARLYSAAEVGIAAAAVTTALLCAQVALLGQGNATITLLGREPGVLRQVLSRVVPIVLIGSLTAAAATLGILAWIDGHLAAGMLSPGRGLLFVGVCVAATVALYFDHVAVGTRRAELALRRSALQAIIGFAVLVAFRSDALTVVLTAWNAGLWVSVVVGGFDIRRAGDSRSDRGPLRLAALFREGLAHHLLTIADRAPGLLLPLVVTELASPEVGGYWYVIWMIALAAWYVPNSAAYALQTELAGRSAGVSDGVRTTLLAGVVVPVLGIVVAWPVLRLFGAEYVHALPALILLLLAVAPQAVTQLALADDRVHLRFGIAIRVLGLGGLVGVAVGALAVDVAGITALAAVWLVVQVGIAGYGQRRIRPHLRLTSAAA